MKTIIRQLAVFCIVILLVSACSTIPIKQVQTTSIVSGDWEAKNPEDLLPTLPDAPFDLKVIWKDASGYFSTTQTDVPNNGLVDLLPEKGLYLKKTTLQPPFQLFTPGGRISEHGVVMRSAEKILEKGDSPLRRTVFLVGENHIGESQLEVAQRILSLLRNRRIDAILVENPDDLPFSWAPLSTLADHPERTIAALTAKLIEDSSPLQTKEILIRVLDNFQRNFFGKYYEFSEEFVLIQTKGMNKDSVLDLEKRIHQSYGEPGLVEFAEKIRLYNESFERYVNSDEFKQSARKVKESHPVVQAYNESRLLSAVDYLYVLLKLRSDFVSFHNIESRELRNKNKIVLDKFEQEHPGEDFPKEGLLDRDRYMTQSTLSILDSNAYKNVILICGVNHLDNLSWMLQETATTDVVITYDFKSLKEKKTPWKPELAILKNPDQILMYVSNYQGSVTVNPDYDYSPGPWDDFILPFEAFIKEASLPVSSNDKDFVSARVRTELPSRQRQESWTLSAVFPDTGIPLVLTKKGNGELKVSYAVPLVTQDMWMLPEGDEWVRYDEMDKPFLSLLKAHKESPYAKSIWIEPRGGQYVAYDENRRILLAHSLHEILDYFTGSLDMKGIHTLYVQINNVSMKKMQTYKDTLNMRINPGTDRERLLRVKAVHREMIAFDLLLFKADIGLRGKKTVQEIVDGHGGRRWLVTLPVLVRIGDAMHSFAVSFRVRAKETALAIVDYAWFQQDKGSFLSRWLSQASQIPMLEWLLDTTKQKTIQWVSGGSLDSRVHEAKIRISQRENISMEAMNERIIKEMSGREVTDIFQGNVVSQLEEPLQWNRLARIQKTSFLSSDYRFQTLAKNSDSSSESVRVFFGKQWGGVAAASSSISP